MSIDDERELRLRLDGVLETITPSPAPVAGTLRKGRTMRTRRRIGVAAGLAAAVGIALAAPSLAHQVARRPPVTPTRPVLTVYPPGPDSPRGLIAWGTINGKRWQIGINGSGSGQFGQCAQVVETNGQHGSIDCGPAANASQYAPDPVAFTGYGDNGVNYEYGVVQPDVARMVIALADGTRLTLYPHPLYGQRWVAFAVPANLVIATGTAYSGLSELAYAVPYRGGGFVTWLRPGERGLPRATYVIGSGVANGVAWSVILHVGPWGYCFSTGTCAPPLPRTATNGYFMGSTSGGGWTIVGEASPSVAYVVGTLSDGSTVRARAVDVGGPKLWAWPVPRGLWLRRVVFYSASGHQIAVQSGAKYPPRA